MLNIMLIFYVPPTTEVAHNAPLRQWSTSGRDEMLNTLCQPVCNNDSLSFYVLQPKMLQPFTNNYKFLIIAQFTAVAVCTCRAPRPFYYN